MAINILEPKVYNRISAGEVVERPASIIKELVENSIDAGASQIIIEIENGGTTFIQVSDDGCGIEKDDLVVAFKPHATSKIKDVDDLDNIESLGFRGEALASISSVCHVRLSSKVKDCDIGYSIKVDGGEFGKIEEVARTNGTTVTARDLFFNTPVRAKFLRKPKSEEGEVTHLVEKFMLSHPEIAFQYFIDGKQIYNTRCCSMQDIIYTIYGREVYDSLLEIDYEENGYHLSGFITKPKISKSNRTFQTLFVNKRYVENYLVSQAISQVYENFLMKGKFPIYVLNLSVPLNCVDVNVHPSKKEVKFDSPNWIFAFVRRAVEKRLLENNPIGIMEFNEKVSENTNEDSLVSSEFNQSGFDPIFKKRNEPLSETEGASYKVSVDKTDGLKPLQEVALNENEELVKRRSEILPENFKDVKLPEEDLPKNKPGNRFLYFDQQETGYAYEIMHNEKQENQTFLSSDISEQMKILGTIFNTYIIVELEDSIYFIDQHAGHERLLYDRLVKDINQNTLLTQDLLVDYDFTLSPIEATRIERLKDELKKTGFNIVNKSGYNYAIKAVPLTLSKISLSAFVDEIVKDGVSYDKKPTEFIHDKLCQTACKHAIKGGDPITKGDCAYLIEQVRKGVMLCPHGRPIVLQMTKKEIEKSFGRIV